MKKLFALMMVSAFAVAFVACGGKNKAEEAAKMKADSIKMADSLAKVAADAAAVVKAKADSVAKADSLAKAASEKKK